MIGFYRSSNLFSTKTASPEPRQGEMSKMHHFSIPPSRHGRGGMGFIVGAGALGAASNNSPSNTVLTLVGAVLGALIGISIGRGRAFVYQLQAQQALCQVEIESNTRRATALTSGLPVKSD